MGSRSQAEGCTSYPTYYDCLVDRQGATTIIRINIWQQYGVSRPAVSRLEGSKGKYGPGVRFVAAVLRHAGIKGEKGEDISPETVIKYRSRAKRSKERLDKKP